MFHVLSELLLIHGSISPTDSPYYVLIFGVGCSITAALLVLLDSCFRRVTGASLLRLEESSCWSYIFAAGVTGIIGASLTVLQTTFPSCLAVAVSWPAFTRMFMGKEVTPPSGSETDEEGGEE